MANTKLSGLTKTAVERTLVEFDQLGRDQFLQTYGYRRGRYQLVIDDRRYDSKAIAGVAMKHTSLGRPLEPSEFSGGDRHVADSLRRLGFTVEDEAGVVSEESNESTTLRLSQVLRIPFDLGYDRKGEQRQPAQVALREARGRLHELFPLNDYKYLASGAAVNLPEIPWLAITRPEVTKTAQEGLYVVYLFSADLQTVFLTVGQGVTAHKKQARVGTGGGTITQRAHASLAQEATAIQQEMGPDLLEGWTAPLELNGTSDMAAAYENAPIVSKEYSIHDLPPENVLVDDLQTVLDLYDEAVAAKSRLNVRDPATFFSPAASHPEPTTPTVSFRPKDASDYVAHIPARTQRRKRDHENIVKVFGEYAASLGLTPTTDVHPRDLVLMTTQGEQILCEIKTVPSNSQEAVRSAIGQLYEYRHFYHQNNNTRLLAVFSKDPGGAYIELLDTLGIGATWYVNNAWEHSNTAQEWELFDT